MSSLAGHPLVATLPPEMESVGDQRQRRDSTRRNTHVYVDDIRVAGSGAMTDKPINNRAWFFVLPVLGFVMFSSIIPAMTVVNYSVQDTMGANNFFWNGDSGSAIC